MGIVIIDKFFLLCSPAFFESGKPLFGRGCPSKIKEFIALLAGFLYCCPDKQVIGSVYQIVLIRSTIAICNGVLELHRYNPRDNLSLKFS